MFGMKKELKKKKKELKRNNWSLELKSRRDIDDALRRFGDSGD